jgi:hypothetical protein
VQSQENAIRLSNLRLVCYFVFLALVVSTLSFGWFRSAEESNRAAKLLRGFWSTAAGSPPLELLSLTGANYAGAWLAIAVVIGCPSIILLSMLVRGLPAFRHVSAWRVFLLSIAVGATCALASTYIRELVLILTPDFIQGIVQGVTDSPVAVGIVGGILFSIVRVSYICKRKTLDWSVWGWKMTLEEASPERPKDSVWEELGAKYPVESRSVRILERFVLPVGALIVLGIAILLFWADAQSTDTESGATGTKLGPAPRK